MTWPQEVWHTQKAVHQALARDRLRLEAGPTEPEPQNRATAAGQEPAAE